MTKEMNDIQDVLFAFDDYSIEGSRGVQLDMVSPDKYEGNPIVARGFKGDPDDAGCCYLSVVYDQGAWRMWYLAQFTSSWTERRVAYAESDDGISWRKPKLGLVEHGGNKQNNFV